MEEKETIQEINLKLIKDFLNNLKAAIWFEKEHQIENPNEKLNLIWNIMYLYDNGYLKSSFLDEEVPVIYTSSAKHPRAIKQNPLFLTNVMAVFDFYEEQRQNQKVELDSISEEKMNEYSKNRKYIQGYYCEYNEGYHRTYNAKQLEKFSYFYPLLTEAGIVLRDLLNEPNQNERKKKIEKWFRVGAEVMKILAPLVPLIINFV